MSAAPLGSVLVEPLHVTDTGATEFDVTIGSGVAAAQVVDIDFVTDNDIDLKPVSFADATLAVTGGKAGDDFVIRVKRYRAAAV